DANALLRRRDNSRAGDLRWRAAARRGSAQGDRLLHARGRRLGDHRLAAGAAAHAEPRRQAQHGARARSRAGASDPHAHPPRRPACARPPRFRSFTDPSPPSPPPALIGAVAFVLAIVLPFRRKDLLLWGLWLWLTILPVFALDLARQTQHLEFTRYTLLASP